MSTIDRSAFLRTYNLTEDTLKQIRITWEDLVEIYNRHSARIPSLEATAKYVGDCLRQVEEVHSLKWRIKEPEHLLEKIIRKELKDPAREITPDNYAEQITDLIGLRALHLFKGDWEAIHDFVVDTWTLKGRPTANVRKGDAGELLQQFKKRKCKIEEHPRGYRSIHYLIKSQPSRNGIIAELQVRTIFEEGWAEIDHRFFYPYDIANLVLGDFSIIFNRLAGSADEMGTFMKLLRDRLNAREDQFNIDLETRNQKVADLEAKIRKLQISSAQKKELNRDLKAIDTATWNSFLQSARESAALLSTRLQATSSDISKAFEGIRVALPEMSALSPADDSEKLVPRLNRPSVSASASKQRTTIVAKEPPNPSKRVVRPSESSNAPSVRKRKKERTATKGGKGRTRSTESKK